MLDLNFGNSNTCTNRTIKVMCTYRQILESIYLLQIIIELLTKKIEYSIYIYGAPERAVFPKIYSEFI